MPCETTAVSRLIQFQGKVRKFDMLVDLISIEIMARGRRTKIQDKILLQKSGMIIHYPRVGE